MHTSVLMLSLLSCTTPAAKLGREDFWSMALLDS